MSLRLYGTISGGGRSAGDVIPSLGSGRYSPGPNIVWPSLLKCEDPNYTINAYWGQPGILATVSTSTCTRRTMREIHNIRVNRNGIQLSVTSSLLIPCGASFRMRFQADL